MNLNKFQNYPSIFIFSQEEMMIKVKALETWIKIFWCLHTKGRLKENKKAIHFPLVEGGLQSSSLYQSTWDWNNRMGTPTAEKLLFGFIIHITMSLDTYSTHDKINHHIFSDSQLKLFFPTEDHDLHSTYWPNLH